MALEDFQKLFKELPEGACWVTGKELRALRDACIHDRADLADTSGTVEPTGTGRVFIVKPGGASFPQLEIMISVFGLVYDADILARIHE